MRTPAEYREEAEGYVRMAEQLSGGRRRLRLLEMAQSCLRLADQAEMLTADGPMNGHDTTPPEYAGSRPS